MKDKINHPDPRYFPNAGDKSCTHSIGLYKSGRCRSCGYKVTEGVKKKAHRLGLTYLLKKRRI